MSLPTSCLHVDVYIRHMLCHVMSRNVYVKRLRTRNFGQSSNCVQSGQSGCMRKGYLKQTRMLRRNPTIESLAEQTHTARTRTSRHATSRAVSFRYKFLSTLIGPRAFFAQGTSRVTTDLVHLADFATQVSTLTRAAIKTAVFSIELSLYEKCPANRKSMKSNKSSMFE